MFVNTYLYMQIIGRYVTRDDLDGPHQKTLKEWQTTYSEALGDLKFTMASCHSFESQRA